MLKQGRALVHPGSAHVVAMRPPEKPAEMLQDPGWTPVTRQCRDPAGTSGEPHRQFLGADEQPEAVTRDVGDLNH
jgi:hypothetical protein